MVKKIVMGSVPIMRRAIQALIAVVALASMAACVGPQLERDANPAFSPHHYRDSHVEMVWTSKSMGNAINIDGSVRFVIEDYNFIAMDITGSLLDEKGKVIVKAMHNFPAAPFKGWETFSLALPIEKEDMAKKVKFVFTYGVDDLRYTTAFDSKL